MPLWQLVVVWRSAEKHMDRGGWRLWLEQRKAL
jgi:hypothetical protein